MGACFSKQPKSDDDLLARLLNNPKYVESMGALSRIREGNMSTQKQTRSNIHPHLRDDQFEQVLGANLKQTRPMCCFGPECTRKSPMHAREFSHNRQNYNGTVGSREACCMQYPAETQTSLGGGCVGAIRYRQPHTPIVTERFDESIVTHAGCAFITSDSHIVMVVDQTNRLNFPCGDLNQGEISLDCAIRETGEELGFNPFVDQNVLHKRTFAKTHISKRTGKRTQTAIYMFEHAQPSSWFNLHFRQNKECSAIFVIPIPIFQYNVEHNPNMFRFHESMAEFVAKML